MVWKSVNNNRIKENEAYIEEENDYDYTCATNCNCTKLLFDIESFKLALTFFTSN